MKGFLLLILLICTTLQAQINFSDFSQTSRNQLDFVSNPKELLDEDGNNLFNSNDFDSLLLNGDSISNYYGYSVSSAGDVNGDGFSDIIVGYTINSFPDEQWCASIFYGGLDMDNIADVTLIGQLNTGIHSVSTAGDVNGDGYSDVIVGTSGFMVYIYYGAISMDTICDFSFYVNNGGMIGIQNYSVSTAGDVNGDGYSDVIIGLSSWQFHMIQGTGTLYIFYGGIILDNNVDVIADVYYKEIPVSTTGDVNGDGYSDIIAGSSKANKAFIYFGSSTMDLIADVILTGGDSISSFGLSVSTAGDVNGDGYSDVIVSAKFGYYPLFFGRGYLFLGGLNMNNEADLILDLGADDYYFTNSVSTAGDVNGDGFSDVIVGSNGFNVSTGRAQIYHGDSSMNNVADVIFTGQSENSDFGKSVSSAGDVNGDGFSDVIIGAPGFNNNRGQANVYMSKPSIKIKLTVLMEGMYSSLYNQLARKDSVTLLLRDVTSPFSIRESVKLVIDSLTFSKQYPFYNAPPGNYYLVVIHFNCVETWSKVGGENLNSDTLVYNYDFTTSNTQAYGNNLKLRGSKYCIYSGDVNQDGFISLSDVISIYNDASGFVSGRFIKTDLTGDNIVDLNDVTLCYNNSSSFVRVIRP